MPLDFAYYSSTQNLIYGVRGSYIFSFDPTSGTKIDEFRFCDGVAFGESTVIEFNGFLYAGVWRGILESPIPFFSTIRDIYAIDFDLTNSVAIGVPAAFGAVPGNPFYPFAAVNQQWHTGIAQLNTDGNAIFGFIGVSGIRLFKLDPTNVAGITTVGGPESNRGMLQQLEWMGFHNAFLIPGSFGPEVYARSATTLLSVGVATPTPPTNYGVAYSIVTDKAYAAMGSADLLKLDVDQLPGNFTWTTLPAILPAGANPMRIKYNPYDSLLYVPNWAHDSISVIDPVTDAALDVITGFDSPIDCVFSPTGKFAVQLSGLGLKKIQT